MKITVPEKQIEVCDGCHRDGYLQACEVCGAQFCLTCQGQVTGSYGFTRLCRRCSEKDAVRAICAEFAAKLSPLYRARSRALERLEKKPRARRRPPTAEQ